jgi:Lower baseplate protein N-terminal domain
MDSLNGFNVTEVFSQIVDGSDTKLITGSKRIRNLHVDSDASFDRFNDRPLDFSNILRVSGDQNITGNFTFQNLSAGKFPLLCSMTLIHSFFAVTIFQKTLS